MGVEIQGRRIDFPVRIGDAGAACAVYPVRRARAAALTGGFTPFSLGPRAFAVVGLVRYRVNDLGVYDELALAFPVRYGGRVGVHITQLPVTEEFTREAGSTLWGLPKWLGEAELEIDGGRATGHLAHAGRHVVTAAISALLPLPFPVRGGVTAFAHRDGAVLASPVRARMRGIRLGLGATVVPGEGHPMAAELRSLHLGRPLVTAIVEHLAFDMDPAVVS
ncbi:acetoacetate decarboxylase family protein [Pseudonocardia xishanensis]|uniref:Acetoacetate decarboxylase n=1 Tax=Pseudonocardia xishanensis TaxID=630995 RepID=A0ABP8RWC8_9PSEU